MGTIKVQTIVTATTYQMMEITFLNGWPPQLKFYFLFVEHAQQGPVIDAFSEWMINARLVLTCKLME